MTDTALAPDRCSPPAEDASETIFREGFYSILYDGPAGHGVLLACLSAGRIVGADMGGGLLSGEFQVRGGDLVAECTFQFSAGKTLVTGQTLAEDVTQRRKLVIPLRMFRGQRCTVDIGFGPVTGRGKFVADPV